MMFALQEETHFFYFCFIRGIRHILVKVNTSSIIYTINNTGFFLVGLRET